MTSARSRTWPRASVADRARTTAGLHAARGQKSSYAFFRARRSMPGGDARIEIRVARGLHKHVLLFLNGRPIKPALRSDGNRLEGVIAGLSEAATCWRYYSEPDQARPRR